MTRQQLKAHGMTIIHENVNAIFKGPRRERRKMARMMQKHGWKMRDREAARRYDLFERLSLEYARGIVQGMNREH